MASRKRLPIITHALIGALAVPLALGCGGGSDNGGSPSPIPSPNPSPGPGPGTSGSSLQITSPIAGAANASPELAVAVQTTGFQIVNNPGGANVAGQGHLRYWLDSDPTGDPAAPGGQDVFQSSFTVEDVAAPGAHTLWIELRNNDGTPLNPRVFRQVAFTTPAIHFSQDLLRIFTNNGAKTCAQSGCHSGGTASFSGGQNLEAANAHANIVNVSSTEKPGVMRVQPGDAENSYLYQKITGAPGIVGAPMPLAGGPLAAADIERIELWIEQGAVNN
jgi:hypothetical protein